MKVIFYDRKNKLEVSNDELHHAGKFVKHGLAIDEDGYGCREWTDPEKQPAYVVEKQIADFIYSGPNCPEYCNWDLWCNLSDLVILRIEE